jgi:hypothetical protein
MDARRSFYLYSKQNDFAERPAPLGQADPVDISHFPPANDNEPASVRLLVRGWMVLLNRLIARIIPFFELMDDISDDYVAQRPALLLKSSARSARTVDDSTAAQDSR